MSTYLRLLAVFVAALTAALAGFNYLMNPYGHFDVPRISAVNELALGFNHRLLLAKSLAVSRIRPASIIFGNSRAEAAYDPQHPGIVDRPVYNLSIGGAGLSQFRRFFPEALAAGRLRHVILALDVVMFATPPDPPEADLDTALLTDNMGIPGGSVREWRRLAFILLSGTTSSDSWWSFTHQRNSVAIYGPSGLRDESYDNEQVVRKGGPRRASQRVESSFLASLPQNIASGDVRDGYRATLAQLQEMVALAAERDIRLTLIINPIHARQNYVLAAAGLWAFYENWKRDLIAAALRSPRQELVSLWDFSGVSSCTAEALPADGNAASVMRWYRESSHFRRILGDHVLDRVFGRYDDGSCPGFGRRLEASTLATTLAEQRAALQRWADGHAEDVAEIDSLVKQYGRRTTAQ